MFALDGTLKILSFREDGDDEPWRITYSMVTIGWTKTSFSNEFIHERTTRYASGIGCNGSKCEILRASRLFYAPPPLNSDLFHHRRPALRICANRRPRIKYPNLTPWRSFNLRLAG